MNMSLLVLLISVKTFHHGVKVKRLISFQKQGMVIMICIELSSITFIIHPILIQDRAEGNDDNSRADRDRAPLIMVTCGYGQYSNGKLLCG
jgi:hypothetical protein